MKLSEYTERWSRAILSLKKPATISTMQSHIRKINSYFGETPLEHITEARVQDHISALSKTLSPKGLRNYWGTFSLILARAKKEGLIQFVPEPDLPKLVKNPQPWLTANQMKQIVNASEGQYKTLFYLLAETGMRIGEALALQWRDIDFENSSLSIERSLFNGKLQAPKTYNAIRNLSISGKLRGQIRSNPRRTQSDFLFTTSKNSPLAANAVLVQKLHPVLRDCFPQCGFHAFRRGNCTIMANLGIPEKIAATRVGHGLGLTFGLYAQSVHLADKPYVELIAKELS
jgi:integrase